MIWGIIFFASLNLVAVPTVSYILKYNSRQSSVEAWFTAISRKVVGKSARDNPERYCGRFWVHCSSKKFKRMALEAMDVCLRMLKESNNRRFESYSVRNGVLIISHITFRDCRVYIFSDKFSRSSCIRNVSCLTFSRGLWRWKSPGVSRCLKYLTGKAYIPRQTADRTGDHFVTLALIHVAADAYTNLLGPCSLDQLQDF